MKKITVVQLRKSFEKKTGEKAILRFKLTHTSTFNDNYTMYLEKWLKRELKEKEVKK